MKKIIFFLFIVFSVKSNTLPLEVSSQVNKAIANVGEEIRFELIIKNNEGVKVSLPEIGDLIGLSAPIACSSPLAITTSSILEIQEKINPNPKLPAIDQTRAFVHFGGCL